MSKLVNRKADIAAMSAIVEYVMEHGTLCIPTSSASEARRIRLQFYLWRRKEQELNADPYFLADFVVRIEGTSVLFAKDFGNSRLREALASVGVKVEEQK